jgi:hypothetical protein
MPQALGNNNSLDTLTTKRIKELAKEYAPFSSSSRPRAHLCAFLAKRAKHHESSGAGIVCTVRAPPFAPDERCKLIRMIVRVAVQLLEVFAGQFILWVYYQGALEMEPRLF